MEKSFFRVKSTTEENKEQTIKSISKQHNKTEQIDLRRALLKIQGEVQENFSRLSWLNVLLRLYVSILSFYLSAVEFFLWFPLIK